MFYRRRSNESYKYERKYRNRCERVEMKKSHNVDSRPELDINEKMFQLNKIVLTGYLKNVVATIISLTIMAFFIGLIKLRKLQNRMIHKYEYTVILCPSLNAMDDYFWNLESGKGGSPALHLVDVYAYEISTKTSEEDECETRYYRLFDYESEEKVKSDINTLMQKEIDNGAQVNITCLDVTNIKRLSNIHI